MKTPLASFSIALLLTACATSHASPRTSTLQERLLNPLYAERYWSEMSEHMADFIRTNDPMAKDPVKGAIIDGERTHALAQVEAARALKHEGISGIFLAAKEEVTGEALLRDKTLSLSSNFLAYPDPSAHVLLTTITDPRGVRFPDTSSLDLGQLQSPYGDQEYVIPDDRVNKDFRTVVLYDTTLNVVLSFAQLSK